MYFKDIIGQEALKQQLIQTAVTQRVSHAQLFSGHSGHGGLPLALAYARYLSCEKREEDDSCGTCASCVKYNKLAHPDLHLVFPVNTTKSVTKSPISSKFIGEWRNAVLENPYMNLFQWLQTLGVENKQGSINVEESHEILKALSYKAYESRYKIVLIWMAEKMNTAASNKLLKILEEPSDNTIFLLTCENQDGLLQTILSRTQIQVVGKIDDVSMKNALNKEYELEEGLLNSTVLMADGNLLEAQRILAESEESSFDNEEFVKWMRLCYSRDVIKTIGWVDQMAGIGRERQKNFLRYALHLFRECLIANTGVTDLGRLSGTEAQFVSKFSPFVNGNNIAELNDSFNKAIGHIERNANPKILFLDLSFHVMKQLRRAAQPA